MSKKKKQYSSITYWDWENFALGFSVFKPSYEYKFGIAFDLTFFSLFLYFGLKKKK